MTTQTRNRAMMLVCGVLAAAMSLSAGGCYERVVAARGLGADQYNVSPSYQTNNAVDNWLFGPQESNKQLMNQPNP